MWNPFLKAKLILSTVVTPGIRTFLRSGDRVSMVERTNWVRSEWAKGEEKENIRER